MSEVLHFKVNAGIKNIVGKELIHSDSIAIIELVKNARDAMATTCKIYFENETQYEGRIVIYDNGRGMNRNDIEDKWLNVAYSEKKGKKLQTGTVGVGVLNTKKSDKYFAGSKGVGRFSCDRLGEELVLYTKSGSGDYLKLKIDWGDFENRGINDQMSSIPVSLTVLDRQSFLFELGQWVESDFEHGTILLINGLRSFWNTNKLRRLISELEKFSPSIDEDICIYLYSENQDKSIVHKLNRRIQNNIFQKLNFKTTRIHSSISRDGGTIHTELYYQDKPVYEYQVKNPYSNLKNVEMEVYYIDPLTRAYFTRNVGIKPVEYGSIFLFYNNYRISPYGNVKNDWLGLDQRKAQGRARYFGTRELLGKIFITDEDNTFEVLSNREGLAQNQAFMELVAFDQDEKTIISADSEDRESYGYVTNIIRQLENFVVNGLEWNRLFDKQDPQSTKVISETEVLKHPDRYTMRAISTEKVRLVCDKLLKSKWKIQDLLVNDDLINSIYQESESKYRKFIEDFLGKVKEKNYSQLSASEKGNVTKIITKEIEAKRQAQKERAEAEKREQEANKVIKEQCKTLEESKQTIRQINSLNSFLRRTANQDTEDLLVSLHSIVVSSIAIRNYLWRLRKYKELPKDVHSTLLSISETNTKIFNIAKYSTLYNFRDKQEIINGELTVFIHECLKQESRENSAIGFFIVDKLDLNTETNVDFIPLEVMMAIQNVVSNSRKAQAKQLVVSNRKLSNGKTKYIFEDDGSGLAEKYKTSPQLVFEKGETTTEGSGLGLHQVKRMVDKLNGKIFVEETKKGFTLCWEI